MSENYVGIGVDVDEQWCFWVVLLMFVMGVVVIIVLCKEGMLIGIMVVLFNLVLLDLLLILFLVDCCSLSFGELVGVDGYVVNVFDEMQQYLLNCFVKVNGDKWGWCGGVVGDGGGVLLFDVFVMFECELYV